MNKSKNDEEQNKDEVGDNLTSLVFILSHFINQNSKHGEYPAWIVKKENEKNGLFNTKRQYLRILLQSPWERMQKIKTSIKNFCKSMSIKEPKILSAPFFYIEEKDECILYIETQNNDSVELMAKEIGDLIKTHKNELFDFNKQINDLKELAIESISGFAKSVGIEIEKLPLNEIRAEKTVFSGISDLVQYEVDFAASGTQIIYPNPLEMSEDHINYIMGNKDRNPFGIPDSIVSNAEQVLLQYKYYYYIYLFHEIFHCYQTLSGHGDPNKGWSFEHDASFISSMLMFAASKLDNKLAAYHFKPGKAEESMLFLSEEGISTHNFLLKGKSEENLNFLKGYEKWRDSFGYDEPVSQDSFSFAETNIRVLDYFKIRITSEPFIEYYNLLLENSEGKFVTEAVQNCFLFNKKEKFPEKKSIISKLSHFST